MQVGVVWALLLSSFFSFGCFACNGISHEEEEGIVLLSNYNARRLDICKKRALLFWNKYVDIDQENKAIARKLSQESNELTVESVKNASQYHWTSFSDPLIRRQFKFLVEKLFTSLPPEESRQEETLRRQMGMIFGTATVCPYGSDATEKQNCTMTLDNGIEDILGSSTNFDELLYYWKAWRDETGGKMRDLYAKFVPLANKEAVINGFPDHGALWRSVYEVDYLTDKFDEIFNQVLPLYKQLHAYVRKKLIAVYGEDNIHADGPIPAHILGHMMGESWANLENLTRPCPNKPLVDITPVMQERNMTMSDMVKISEDFFESLGLPPMTYEFWNHSIFERIPGRMMTCHPQSFDLCNDGDFRIVMCGKVNMNNLKIIHHEMGHIQYYMHYTHQPHLFRKGANEGFHEAIGDTIALSVFTPTHWKSLGFIEDVTNDEEQDINALFSTALDKLPLLPHTYVVDKWRWDLFNGTIKVENMNSKWWEYRLKYQGNCPSVRRTESDLDPASLYHIPADVSYARYFTALILQFQFHKALCDAAGYTGPLHKCDIYGSLEAGERLKAMMSLGISKPWPEALKVLTNGKVDDFDVSPMLEYFQPLQKWLEKENENEVVGWKSDDPTICP